MQTCQEHYSKVSSQVSRFEKDPYKKNYDRQMASVKTLTFDGYFILQLFGIYAKTFKIKLCQYSVFNKSFKYGIHLSIRVQQN